MMNQIRFLRLVQFLIFTFFLIHPVAAQNEFEGRIKIEITGKYEKNVLNYFKKESSARIEVEGEQVGVMIFRPDKTYMLMPENKVYMELDGSILDIAKKYGGEQDSEKKLKEVYDEIEKYRTGETKVIKGYSCEKYYKTDELNETEMWVTGELGKFLFMQDPGGGDSWMSEIANKSFFPMLVISKDKKSGEIDRLEVTEVEKKSLSSDLFDAPAGYQKMSMPGMFE